MEWVVKWREKGKYERCQITVSISVAIKSNPDLIHFSLCATNRQLAILHTNDGFNILQHFYSANSNPNKENTRIREKKRKRWKMLAATYESSSVCYFFWVFAFAWQNEMSNKPTNQPELYLHTLLVQPFLQIIL